MRKRGYVWKPEPTQTEDHMCSVGWRTPTEGKEVKRSQTKILTVIRNAYLVLLGLVVYAWRRPDEWCKPEKEKGRVFVFPQQANESHWKYHECGFNKSFFIIYRLIIPLVFPSKRILRALSMSSGPRNQSISCLHTASHLPSPFIFLTPLHTCPLLLSSHRFTFPSPSALLTPLHTFLSSHRFTLPSPSALLTQLHTCPLLLHTHT